MAAAAKLTQYLEREMSDWSAGYVSNIGYTFGYYHELNPLRLQLAFLNAGLAFPEIGTACELGYGQGISTNLHAASSVTQWYGTDFNPSQVFFAQQLARSAEAGAKLFDESFSEFSNRSDLPDFDYIGMHGIWSWISDANRQVIVDFIRRKLKVGGVLYISYNTLPGWASFAPMRQLMTLHADIIGAEGHGIVNRIDGAVSFVEKMLETNPLYARANPSVNDRMKNIKEQNRHYLAHEYFNRDWHPMHFSDLAQWLEPAKLNFACSAHYLDHIDLINLGEEQRNFLEEITDTKFRQAVRDFMVNQQFRRDYWVKGARKLDALEQAELVRSQRVVLQTHPDDIELKVSGSLGEATLSEEIYRPVIEALADYKKKTLARLAQAVAGKNINFPQVLQAIMILNSKGHVASVQAEEASNKVKRHTVKLNAFLRHKARGSGDIGYLGSPVTGGGVAVSRFQQLFITAMELDKKKPEQMADHVWQVLKSQGQKLLKEGTALETEEEHLAELNRVATEFIDKRLPALRALQVI